MALTKIITEGIDDDAVTEAKLANAINTAVAANTAKDLSNLDAANITSGTIPTDRFPTTLPVLNGSNLTNLAAGQLSGTLPAISGANLTDISTTPADGSITQAKLNFPVANRNLIINGAMQIAQRGTSFTTGDNAEHYVMDRWALYVQNSNSRFTVTQSEDAPDGFGRACKIDCTTADTSLASNEEVQFYQKVEGFNTQDFAKGTSAAKQYTLSFYVKTNKTGTYIVRLLGRDNTTSHVAASYTVSDTNWNRYTITFPADTTNGRSDNDDNGESLRVVWWLVAGSAVNSGSLQTTWANSSDTGAATGQVNFADSTSNDFFITGCQLEIGSVATDFEHKSFGQDLWACKRYYQLHSMRYMAGNPVSTGNSGSIGGSTLVFSPEMRATPVATHSSLMLKSASAAFVNASLHANYELTKQKLNYVVGKASPSNLHSYVIFANLGTFEAEL